MGAYVNPPGEAKEIWLLTNEADKNELLRVSNLDIYLRPDADGVL